MGKVIAVTNQKGGVGKTTTAVNLAYGLAMKNKKTLLIDVDAQANATFNVNYDVHKKEQSLLNVFLNEVEIKKIIKSNVKQNLDLIPCYQNFNEVDVLINSANKKSNFILKKQIDSIKKDYDFIIIDTPPTINIVTRNVLVASDSVLIPLQAEHFALQGIAKLLKVIKDIKNEWNPNIKVEGVLITMLDPRTKLNKDVYQETKKIFGNKVYKSTIGRSVKFSESSMSGMSIFEYDFKSKPSQQYLAFVEEVINGNK